ncbi:MAG: hypothetical protein Q9217_001265 [Psora testacea]
MATKMSKNPQSIDSCLKTLSISSTKPANTPESIAPPDSWEEEAASPTSTSSPASAPISSPTTPLADSTPGPPPPTPISPTHRRDKSTDWSSFPPSPHSRESPSCIKCETPLDKPNKRPEKSSAAAGRMIAGALGVKSPKMTEEQRRYEKVVREKERKRIEGARDEEQRREREKEEARRAVWDE